jgi:hypothetical protein
MRNSSTRLSESACKAFLLRIPDSAPAVSPIGGGGDAGLALVDSVLQQENVRLIGHYRLVEINLP